MVPIIFYFHAMTVRQRRIFAYLFIVLFITVLQSCNNSDKSRPYHRENALFTSLPATETGIAFVNEVKDRKDFNIFSYRNYYNGGGVAIGDINNDGLADIYLTGNMSGSKLYLNKGNWKFEDITDKSGAAGKKGWTTGVSMADVNGDGLLDLYVCNSGDVQGDNRENELFINNGNLTFTERAAEYGLNDKGLTTHASFFDYDRDGDLDCYILNNSFKAVNKVEEYKIKREERDSIGGHKLMRNDGGHFTDVSAQAGIFGSSIGYGLGVSVSDLNGDMLPDIYVSNDFWERDYLYVNRGDGTFSEEITERTSIISTSSMGADVADLNNDGYADIFTTDMLPADNMRIKTMARFEETNIKELRVRSSYHYQIMQNCLQYNDGHGNFQEMAALAGTMATDWSWASLMFDMDNDGWKDIFVSNGMYHDITSMDFVDFISDRENIKKYVQEKGKFDYEDLVAQMPTTKISNYAFINQRDKTFKNLSDSLGLAEPSFSNGSAYGDLDNDGDLDLVVNNISMPCFVYRNNTEKMLANNYLKIKFKGEKQNPFGVGAEVILYSNGTLQAMQNFPTRGFESSVQPDVVFGLGKTNTIDSLKIIWPDLRMQTLKNVTPNQTIVVNQTSATGHFKPTIKKIKSIFRDATAETLKGNHAHRENKFNDFDQERLLTRKISSESPKIIQGDLNGDKLEDFMLLGAFGDPDKIFVQQRNGQFIASVQPALRADSIFESTCGVMIDFDKDGDTDVILGSGGNEFGKLHSSYGLRCYENDGAGKLKKVASKLPSIVGNFSVVLAEDFDHDGDDDLFFGGRVIPGNYGLIPRSFLFRNDGTTWTNITPKSMEVAGMVTGAVWTDFDGDAHKDLVVVGDWMPVKIFKNTGKDLMEARGLPNTEGWWTAIANVDLNNDGKEDLVLGNWGLNSKFTASVEKPLTMFVKDFDQNGKSEFVINWYPPLETKAFPFASKADMTSQMPALKKKSLKYADYAQKTYEDLLTPEQRHGALEYKASHLESAVIFNEGNFNFRMQSLPLEAQVSPVYAILADDLNGDKNPDLMLLGNLYGLKPEVGRMDANNGVILTGNGKGDFIYITPEESGINIKGEVRDVKKLHVPGKSTMILIGRNNTTAIVLATQK